MNSFALSKQLLWKDYRQLRPALVGCWALLAVVLMLVFVRQLTVLDRDRVLPDAIMLVFAAPTLVAMAASGILIGHERETRTWNWSSSLPISWTSSLISKTLVWIASSVAMVSTLLAVFYLLMWVCRLRGYTGETIPAWITSEIVVASVLVVPTVIYIFFSWAALLWRDTLSAFFCAALVVSLLYILAADLLPRWFLQPYSAGSLEPGARVFAVGLQVLLIVLPATLAVRAFRWRWTTGQLASLGLTSQRVSRLSQVQRQAVWQGFAWSGSPPGEFYMLLAHGVCTAWLARLLISVGSIGLAVFIGITDNHFEDVAAVFCMFGAGLLGTTAFSNEHAQSGYRFFADRGVSWFKYLVAHTLPPLIIAMVPIVLLAILSVTLGTMTWRLMSVLAASLSFFTVGVFCSLCTRVPLLNICMAVGAILLSIASLSALEGYYRLLMTAMPESIIFLVLFVETVVVILATGWLIRRWLIRERVSGVVHYLLTLLVAILPINLLICWFCFLAIPNVPWQGLPDQQFKRTSDRPKLVYSDGALGWSINLQNRMYSYDISRLPDVVQYGYGVMTSQIYSEAGRDNPVTSVPGGMGVGEADTPGLEAPGTQPGAQPDAQPTNPQTDARPSEGEPATEPQPPAPAAEPNKSVREMLVEGTMLKGFAQLERQLAELEPNVTADAGVTGYLAERTAWLGAYAIQELKDVELSRRAWIANRKLLDLVDYSAVDSQHSLNGRLASALLRSHLTSADWALLRTGGSLAELQPQKLSQATASRLVQMMVTELRKKMLSVPLLRWVPPIRWYHERSLAVLLQRQLDLVAGRPSSVPDTAIIPFLAAETPVHIIQRVEDQLPQE